MLSIFKRKIKNTQGLCSIEITPQGIAYAYPPKNICGFQEHKNNDPESIENCLSNIVIENKLQDINCNWILHPDHYHLLLIDAPQVPTNEYKSAVRWQLKEMIDFPLEDTAIDIFFPAQEITAYNKKIYTIAAQKSFLQQTTDIIYHSQLNPVSIDIHELSIRNLLSSMGKSNEPISFLHLLENRSIFLIIKNDAIHFVRHIMYGLNKLADTAAFDNLIAEIKRCFDYYHYQLEHPPPDKILLTPLLTEKEISIKKLADALAIDASCLDLEESQMRCYVTLGGALKSKET